MRHRITTHKKNPWYSPVITILLIAVIFWMGSVVIKSFQKYRDVRTARNQSRSEVMQLQEKNADLEQKINTLSTDYGLDQEIKTQYRVVRPGEEIVIIVDNDESAGEPEDTKTFWDKFRAFIGL